MNIILLGPPGVGKGTLGAHLQQEFHIPHISSGDIIRREISNKTPLGLEVAALTAVGKYLPDTPEYMGKLLALVRERLAQDDCVNGFLMDGIPRTAWQVEQFDQLLASIGKKVDVALLLEADPSVIVSRLGGRWICPGCQSTFQITTPTTWPTCSKCACQQCKKFLVRRPDDDPTVVQKRLQLYLETMTPVIAAYQQRNLLTRVDGGQDREKVLAAAKTQLFPKDYLKTQIPYYMTPKGVPFYNLVEVFKNPMLVHHIVAEFTQKIQAWKPHSIAAPEARALPIFGALLSKLMVPGIFIRKAGKLPPDAPKYVAHYNTAYSTDSLEMNQTDLRGKRVVIVDDGISSGGTTLATIQLLQQAGAEIVGILAVVRYKYRAPDPNYAQWEPLTHTLFELGN